MEFKLKLNASQISDALLHFAHARILTLARIKTHRAKDPACMIEYKTLHIKKSIPLPRSNVNVRARLEVLSIFCYASFMQPISIIVPTYNRLAMLKDCLAALQALRYPDYEIIVVNDGSADGTRGWLNSIVNEKIRVIHHEKNQGLSAARNSGIIAARYQLIAFIDDDCVAHPNWLVAMEKEFDNPRIGFVIGKTVYMREGYRGHFPERVVHNDCRWPKGCNIAYRKEVFSSAGNFDDAFFRYNNEDSEMAIRAVAAGFLFASAPHAVVSHQKTLWTAQSLLRSARNASVWPILKQKYPASYRIFNPPITAGYIVNAEDYALLLFLPLTIPFLLIRYFLNGKRDLKLFFTKWPRWLLLRRLLLWRESIRIRTWMI